MKWCLLVLRFAIFVSCIGAGSSHADVAYRGVNLSGGEASGCTTKDAKYGFKYIYPSTAFMDSFLASGMNIFRLAFCWERVQPQAMAALDAAEITRIDTVVNYLTSRNAVVILDPHNYASYWGVRIGNGTTNEMLADLWSKLAARYANNPRVFFGLMNEPNGISGDVWLAAANASIAAIRKTGATNRILVPGVVWTGAHSWTGTYYGIPNAVTMLQINDPGNNYVFEVHQYLDKDSSGTKADCLSEDIGVKRLALFSSWLRENNKKGFLAEFAGGVNETCFKALANMLENVRQNSDIWVGWTYWSTGPWQGNYMFNLLPKSDPAKPNQIDVIKNFLPCVSADCAPTSPSIQSINFK